MHLAGEPEADRLLAENPFALIVGMILDQQVTMESAFAGPAKLRDRLGELTPAAVLERSPDELGEIFAQSPAVHRFPSSMATRVHALAAVIAEDWGGDAQAIWTAGDPTGRDVLKRLKALPGFGAQKSQIFLALLGKQFGLEAEGWREAAGDYGDEGARRSIADVVDAQTLGEVRAFKKAQKAQAKAAKHGDARAKS